MTIYNDCTGAFDEMKKKREAASEIFMNLSENCYFGPPYSLQRDVKKSFCGVGEKNATSGSRLDQIRELDAKVGFGPPIGLETQYSTLHKMLSKSLYDGANSVALLIGHHGHGKRMVIERCLASIKRIQIEKSNSSMSTFAKTCSTEPSHASSSSSKKRPLSSISSKTPIDEIVDSAGKPHLRSSNESSKIIEENTSEKNRQHVKFFRIVRLNGILLGGNDAAAAREMVQQLSTSAAATSSNSHTPPFLESGSSYNNVSRSTYLGESNHSSLRVQHRSHKMGIVATNTSFHFNVGMLDKCMKEAKADGEPILVICFNVDTFGNSRKQLLLYHLLEKAASGDVHLSLIFVTCRLTVDQLLEKRIRSRAVGTRVSLKFNHLTSYEALVNVLLSKIELRNIAPGTTYISTALQTMRESLSAWLLDQSNPVGSSFKRNFKLGKDIRWFCRVLVVAFSKMREPLNLKQTHLLSGLEAMGTTISCHSSHASSTTVNSFQNVIQSESSDILSCGSRASMLKNLPGSQIAVLLSAAHVISKSVGSGSGVDKQQFSPVTFDRVRREYESFTRNSLGGVDRHSDSVFQQAFLHLMDSGLIKFAVDHSGGNTFQYSDNHSWNCPELRFFAHLPIHINVEIDMELKAALTHNLLDCSEALRNWGLKKYNQAQ